MVIGVYREYNFHCVHLRLAGGYLAPCDGRGMLWKGGRGGGSREGGGEEGGRERGREVGREGWRREVGREGGEERGRDLSGKEMYHFFTLVTGRMFLELLHNSLNIFSVRDPE